MTRLGRISMRVLTLGLIFGAGLAIQPVLASSGLVDFDDHWLAAGCTANGRTRTVATERGPAVELPGRAATAELLCNITADGYHNWIQLWAEDNTPTGAITATLYRQDVVSSALAAPEALISATTVDTAGPQVVGIFDDLDAIGDLDETRYLYYLTISMERSEPGPVLRVYNASLRDVF